MAWTAARLREVTEKATARLVEEADAKAHDLWNTKVSERLWCEANRGASILYVTDYPVAVLDALARLLRANGFTCTRNETGQPYLQVQW